MVARVVQIRLVTRSASPFFLSFASDFAPNLFCLRNAWILCSPTERRGNSVPAKKESKSKRKRKPKMSGMGSVIGTWLMSVSEESKCSSIKNNDDDEYTLKWKKSKD